jgi:glutamine cyclotransferase
VTGWIDLRGLLPARERAGDAVLNGIAYDAANDRLLVTGKLWPRLFEIKLISRQSAVGSSPDPQAPSP